MAATAADYNRSRLRAPGAARSIADVASIRHAATSGSGQIFATLERGVAEARLVRRSPATAALCGGTRVDRRRPTGHSTRRCPSRAAAQRSLLRSGFL
jgi:hypothetical protein